MEELKQIYRELRESNIYDIDISTEEIFNRADKDGIIYLLVQTISKLYKQQKELKEDLRKAKYKLKIF